MHVHLLQMTYFIQELYTQECQSSEIAEKKDKCTFHWWLELPHSITLS